MPMQDLDELAASHCQQHRLSYRRRDVGWISPTLKRADYECGRPEQRLTRKLEVPHSTTANPATKDPKVAAWTKAKAATDAWALCLRFDAEREAKGSTDPPQSVAQEVIGACSGLEHAVHEPLEAVGEDSTQFQADLRTQAVQNALDTVTSVRIKAGVPISGPPAF
jgi:hypothetical protein